jgi:hypothetical protein
MVVDDSLSLVTTAKERRVITAARTRKERAEKVGFEI